MTQLWEHLRNENINLRDLPEEVLTRVLRYNQDWFNHSASLDYQAELSGALNEDIREFGIQKEKMTIIEMARELRLNNDLRIRREGWGGDTIGDIKGKLQWLDTGERFSPSLDDIQGNDWKVILSCSEGVKK